MTEHLTIKMNKEICGEKLVKLKKKNSSTKNEPVKQEKRQKVLMGESLLATYLAQQSKKLVW